MHFAHLANTLIKDEESARDNPVLACNFAKYLPIQKKFTDRLSNKPFLIWLLTTPPRLKYVAILPCNLSLVACFVGINVSQGSVATYARCDGIFNIHLTTNLPRNLPVKKIQHRFRFDRTVTMSLWHHFFGACCSLYVIRRARVTECQSIFKFRLPSVIIPDRCETFRVNYESCNI